MARNRNREEIQQSIEDLAYRESQLLPVVNKLEEEKAELEEYVSRFTETSKNEISNLKADLEGYTREVENQKKVIEELNDDIIINNKQIKDQSSDIKDLTKETEKQMKALASADSSVENSLLKIEDLKKEIKIIEEEIDIKKTVNDEAMKELEETCSKRQDAAKTLDSMIGKVKDKEAELEVATAFVAAKNVELTGREEKLAQDTRSLAKDKENIASEIAKSEKIIREISDKEAGLLLKQSELYDRTKVVDDRSSAVDQKEQDLILAKARLKEEIKRAKLQDLGII